jgi:hypothetical protein
MLVHFAPAGYASVFLTTDPPRTEIVTPRGLARIGNLEARKSGLEIPEGTTSVAEYPLKDMADVQRVAVAYVFGQTVGVWHNVPDSVPRGLLETARWVNDQVKAATE